MPLIVKPISANLVSDKDFMGKQDPYCVVLIGNEKKRTKTTSGGGKNPEWTETFQFNEQASILRVQVWDDDTFSDDLIGEGSVNLNQCYQNPNRTENEYVDLIKNGRSAGRVLLSLEWQGMPMGGGYVNQNWGGQQQNWGNYPPQNQGWGGQQGGWGNQPPQNQGWSGQNQGWGGQQQGGWSGQQQGGWGGQQQGGWGGHGHNHGGW